MLSAILIMALLGLFLGLGLSFSAKLFQQDEDKVDREKVLNVLPGINCGLCGYAGCAGYAEAISKNEAGYGLCIPGGAEVKEKIAGLLGKEVAETSKKTAEVACNGGLDSTEKYEYFGVPTCSAAHLAFSGPKDCRYACLGYGDCFKVCPFGAIYMNKKKLPVIIKEKCTACQQCIKACPKNIIRLTEYLPKHFIYCSSHDKAAVVRKYCKVGCIGCGLCVKACPFDAIELKNNLAVIDPLICTNCNQCVEKCPTNSILFSIERS
ncbi:MAG: RnfABCDGE type electron transport complex subunit B [Candidatus Margulisiibacteriota bacterium]|jgi:Na+-translocating ferredoxin:NAD+ oxidoreductase RNF subunit RnfB